MTQKITLEDALMIGSPFVVDINHSDQDYFQETLVQYSLVGINYQALVLNKNSELTKYYLKPIELKYEMVS